MLLKMTNKKNRRQTELCVSTLKDLFIKNILDNKKYFPFIKSITQAQESGSGIYDEQLLTYYVEDVIHKKYGEFINVIRVNNNIIDSRGLDIA